MSLTYSSEYHQEGSVISVKRGKEELSNADTEEESPYSSCKVYDNLELKSGIYSDITSGKEKVIQTAKVAAQKYQHDYWKRSSSSIFNSSNQKEKSIQNI